MKHKEIYEKFKKHFKLYAGLVKSWVPNSDNSIKLILKNDDEYIYTYKGREMRFEKVKGDGAMKC